MPRRRQAVGAIVANVAVIVRVAAAEWRRCIAASSVVFRRRPSSYDRGDFRREERSKRKSVADVAVAGVRGDVGQPAHRLPAVVDGALKSRHRVQLSFGLRRVVRRQRLVTPNTAIIIAISKNCLVRLLYLNWV